MHRQFATEACRTTTNTTTTGGESSRFEHRRLKVLDPPRNTTNVSSQRVRVKWGGSNWFRSMSTSSAVAEVLTKRRDILGL
mmetsp:Transcript_48010/g.102844  ORF Transcript_48010/g.102844 Transcript_48010/m.102844 type:complete len:81 (-) Transcript_48010:237-479(-)